MDLYDLIPPDVDRFNHLFGTAIQGSALETDDPLGVAAAVDKARAKKAMDARERDGVY